MISFSLPRTFGKMVGSNKQGYAILSAMAFIAIGSIVVINLLQGFHGGTVPQAVGAATEGTETRFGVLQSSTFASATTLTSTGAVDSFHDSYTPLGGGVTILNMMFGEVAPGGTGSGLYGILVLAVDHRVRGRVDGRADTRVSRQEARRARDEVRVALPP